MCNITQKSTQYDTFNFVRALHIIFGQAKYVYQIAKYTMYMKPSNNIFGDRIIPTGAVNATEMNIIALVCEQ